MSRAPDQFAPSWLPRQQRRRIDRELHKLLRRDVCSICGSTLKHNSHTASGLDVHANVVLAGECCMDQVVEVFGMGLYSNRQYDFLSPRDSKPDGVSELAPEQIADAIPAYQQAIAETDKRLDDVERRGGGARATTVTVLDYPWKTADRDWFQRNPERAHRVRSPLPGEVNKETPPAGHVPLMLVRQVEPGFRVRAAVFLDANFLPLPDDEAVVHALFEVGMGREAVPRDRQALRTLSKKYQASGAAS